MILNDVQIAARCNNPTPMITPFVDFLVRETPYHKVISYGLSSFGYDIRCSNLFKVFRPSLRNAKAVDPKNFDIELLQEFSGDECVIPPHSFALACTLETFNIPSDVIGIVVGKSTLARCGINVVCTPAEPGWAGVLTLEFQNMSHLPAIIYANEGCAQMLFFQGDRPEVTYADRDGKYQRQVGVTTAKV